MVCTADTVKSEKLKSSQIKNFHVRTCISDFTRTVCEWKLCDLEMVKIEVLQFLVGLSLYTDLLFYFWGAILYVAKYVEDDSCLCHCLEVGCENTTDCKKDIRKAPEVFQAFDKKSCFIYGNIAFLSFYICVWGQVISFIQKKTTSTFFVPFSDVWTALGSLILTRDKTKQLF